MSQVIKVEKLSKSFIISHEGRERYTALRDVVSKKTKDIFSNPFKKNNETVYKEKFWALKDLNFEINQGDRVGIIGRNGAGKSTLLKILSRITEPSSGTLKIKGRIASLLEVGTGFHPELTGRENVFLNGAILGMNRQEIKSKFDEIVDFAGVEQFLDTPVKRYSSGMYVRLAFAVAAHLEPEILVVDEVLAVGDAQFQKKCLGKMEDVSRNEGRTVLFVSHNIAAIKALCTSSILLQNGEMKFKGDVLSSLVEYMNAGATGLDNGLAFQRRQIPANKKVYLQTAQLKEKIVDKQFCFDLLLEIHAESKIKIGINIFLKDNLNMPFALGCVHYPFSEAMQLLPGENKWRIESVPLSLAKGEYSLSVELVVPGSERLDIVESCISFEVTDQNHNDLKLGVDQTWGMGCLEIKFNDFEIK